MTGPKVLLVDDEPNVLAGLRRHLTGHFALSCASNGVEALDVLESEGPFAVVVSDMRMPLMDGRALLREIRRRSPATVRMVLSGHADFDAVVAAVNEGGMFQFHLKPVHPETLHASIDRAVLQHQLLLRSPNLPTDCGPLLDDVAALRRGIATGQLCLHLQPQLRLSDGQIIAAEALVRWHHPTRGALPPGSFFEIVKAGGLMGEVTTWVLDAACAQIRTWQGQGLGHLHLAVNVTSTDIADPGFPGQVAIALHRHDVPPDRLELELTEEAAIADVPQARAAIEAVARLGVGWSIDDFGTGYSSFDWLRQLPVKKLKIDRAFVKDIASVPNGRRVLQGLVEMAHSMGMHVIAEGAETDEELRCLVEARCDSVQGFVIARPMPAEDFAAWFDRFKTAGDLMIEDRRIGSIGP